MLTSLNFVFILSKKEGASLHKKGSSLVQNLIYFVALWWRAVQDRWDCLRHSVKHWSTLLPSSSWLVGSRLPNSIPQSPGPLWCSWWPSPTSEDPGWARDCQGSLSRRATTSGDQSCAQQSHKVPCKSFLVTSTYKAPIMQSAACVFWSAVLFRCF